MKIAKIIKNIQLLKNVSHVYQWTMLDGSTYNFESRLSVGSEVVTLVRCWNMSILHVVHGRTGQINIEHVNVLRNVLE